MNNLYEINDEQEIKLSDYFNLIIRYKWVVIVSFLLVLIFAAIYTARSPRIYSAYAKVLLEDRMTNDLLFTSVSNKTTSINNNIQILKSRPVRRIVLQILRTNPKFDSFQISKTQSQLDYLASIISVDTERDTDILTINIQSTNPEEAKEIANAFANSLMQQDTDYARIEFTNTKDFLASQLEEKESILAVSEEDLRSYKIENGISMLSQETEELIRQSSELDAFLSQAQTDLTISNNQVAFLQAELLQQDSLLTNVNSVLSSPLLEQLKKEIIFNQTRYFKLLAKPEYDSTHPELVLLNKEIDASKNKLEQEIQRILLIKSGSSDPLLHRADLIQKISMAKINQNINQSKVNSLLSEIEEYSLKMSVLPDTEVNLARLTRNFLINEKIYSMLIEKYEDAKIVEKSKIGNVRIMEEAITPTKPIKPNKKMNMIIGIVLGLGIGVGLAFVLHSLDSKIRTFDDVRKNVGLSILGTIPFINIYDSDIVQIEKMLDESKDEEEKKLKSIKHQIESRLITHYAPKSSVSESFRILRTNLVSKRKDTSAFIILITSSGPKEGKSTIQANLATALSQTGSKVVLVDLDLRRPMVHSLFDFKKEVGISDFLVDKTQELEPLVKKTAIPNLDVITSGYIPPNPSELLGSVRMDDALALLKSKYDYILLDSPPVIAVTDSMILAKKVDALNLVVRVGKADKNVVKRAKELLDNIDVKITGAIINGVQPHKYYSSYEYNYYYYYYYGKEEDSKYMPKVSRKNKSLS